MPAPESGGWMKMPKAKGAVATGMVSLTVFFFTLVATYNFLQFGVTAKP